MKSLLTGLALVGLAAIGSARANVIYSNTLQDVNGAYGAGVATTTTDASGKRTTVAGLGGGANRASGSNMVNQWFQANVGAGGTAGITSDFAFNGNGSAFFSTTNGDSKADLQFYLPSQAALSSLTSLSYDFYRSSTSTTAAQFAPVLRLDILKDGRFAGSLVLENVYQQQANAPVDTWTMLAATLNQGIFWATNAALGPTNAAAAGGQKTLQAWIDANAGSTLTVYGMSTGVGSGWSNTFRGGVDDVDAVFGSISYAANFEVSSPTAVPEPMSLVAILTGLGMLGLMHRRKAG